MKMICSFSLGMIFSFSVMAQGQDDQARGLAIATQGDASDQNWGNAQVSCEMELHTPKGKSRSREFLLKFLEGSDGDKSIVIFETPTDIRGTALLFYTHIEGNDDQWLYLPALRRVRRIATNNKSGSFVGSEFSYEDFSSQDLEKYTYRFIAEEENNGIACFMVERRPNYKNSGYKYQKVWYDQVDIQIQRIDYYDLEGELLKTLTVSDYQLYLGNFWRAGRYDVYNHQSGKSSSIVWEWSDESFKVGLTENDFNSSSSR